MKLEGYEMGDTLYFLVQIILIIVVATICSILCGYIRLPHVVGELGAGLILGRTVLEKVDPGLYNCLFSPRSFGGIDKLAQMGLMLLVFCAAMEIDFANMENKRNSVLKIAFCGFFIPFAAGLASYWASPQTFFFKDDRSLLVGIMVATFMGISAIPVISKTLVDLHMERTMIGQTILVSCIFIDLLGWPFISGVIGAAQGKMDLWGLAEIVVYCMTFVILSFILASRALQVTILFLHKHDIAQPEMVVIVLTLFLFAGVTEWIGISVIFGSFMAGLIIARVSIISRRYIEIIMAWVFSIFAPVFLVSVGVKADLGILMDLQSLQNTFWIILIGSVSKLVGGYIGARASGFLPLPALIIGNGINSRGIAEIVIATTAFSLGFISEKLFAVLIVFALVTSIMTPISMRILVGWSRRGLSNRDSVLTNKARDL
jgi:Kef-type K+ transport system membrane component KefB